jgi:exosortase sorting signal-containing protein
MRTTRRARWGSIAVATLLLHGLTGWWSTPVCAQGPRTQTFSTSSHTTYTVPGGGSFGANECPFLGTACPVGTTPQVTGAVRDIAFEETIGPGTTTIGQCRSQTFVVTAGTINLNTNTHIETFVNCVAAVSTAIPTLSTWAMIALVALMVAGGLLALHRRRSPTS